jgi:hypothetical protein
VTAIRILRSRVPQPAIRATKLIHAISCWFIMKSYDEVWGIRLLTVSTYDHANRAVRDTIADPTWDQVAAAIIGLDGARRSELAVVSLDGSCLVIAGGDGRFTAASQTGRGSPCIAASLIDRGRGNAEEDVMIGGLRNLAPCSLHPDRSGENLPCGRAILQGWWPRSFPRMGTLVNAGAPP